MARTSVFDFTDVPPAEFQNVPLKLSPQQSAIANWVEDGTGNALIIAVAGAGKTTTLIEMLSRMPGRVAFAAYNKRIADEIKEKVEARAMGNLVKVATFHSFGYASWRRAHPAVKINAYKIRDMLRANSLIPEDLHEFIDHLVSLVRASAIGIVCPINSRDAWNEVIEHYGLEELLQEKGRYGSLGGYDGRDDEDLQDKRKLGMGWALKILQKSIRRADKVIDFDDQLYMPLYANMPIDQFDWVLIDEAQDSNPTRRALAKAMLRPGGRLLAVGDPAQAIYGFTGADSESLENIKQEFGCVELGLTVSYRCPQAVVRFAQNWVSHIEAHESAPEGIVRDLPLEDWLAGVPTMSPSELLNSSVLCRKNSPLVDLAFSLIRQGVPCHVEGRDIGGQIKTLANKWKLSALTDVRTKAISYKEDQVRKFLAKGQEQRADSIADRVDTLVVLIDGLLSRDRNATLRDLNDWCDRMFGDTTNGQKNGLTLSSIHKSKGREWQTVYWYGANAWQPSPFARQEWQLLQERNLMYVAATRAKLELVNVHAPTK